LCSLYLCFFKEIHHIFELDENKYNDYIYTLWIIYIKKCFSSLLNYNEEENKWTSLRGEYVFLKFLIENQLENQEILSLNFEDEKKEFSIILNK
jgi:hypothetical protein